MALRPRDRTFLQSHRGPQSIYPSPGKKKKKKKFRQILARAQNGDLVGFFPATDRSLQRLRSSYKHGFLLGPSICVCAGATPRRPGQATTGGAGLPGRGRGLTAWLPGKVLRESGQAGPGRGLRSSPGPRLSPGGGGFGRSPSPLRRRRPVSQRGCAVVLSPVAMQAPAPGDRTERDAVAGRARLPDTQLGRVSVHGGQPDHQRLQFDRKSRDGHLHPLGNLQRLGM